MKKSWNGFQRKPQSHKPERRRPVESEKILEIISDVMHLEPGIITDQTRFTEDLGMDSLSMYEILIRIEKEFDIEIDQEASEQFLTAGDLIYAVNSLYGIPGRI